MDIMDIVIGALVGSFIGTVIARIAAPYLYKLIFGEQHD